jgi:putative redox protein
MKASVNWEGVMTFTGLGPSGFPIQMDAESAFGGSDSGVRPMEMIAWG